MAQYPLLHLCKMFSSCLTDDMLGFMIITIRFVSILNILYDIIIREVHSYGMLCYLLANTAVHQIKCEFEMNRKKYMSIIT